MKTIERILADNVRMRRKALKLSQEKLAEKAKISMHTVLRLEKGRQRPQRANLISIAEALGCTVEDLYKADESGGIVPIFYFGEDVKAAIKEMKEETKIIPSLAQYLSGKDETEQSEILKSLLGLYPPGRPHVQPSASIGTSRKKKA